MGAAILGASHVVDSTTGEFVNTTFVSIARMLHEWDPTISVAWIPPSNRDERDVYPYAIVHSPLGKEPYIIMHLQEEEMTADLIPRLYEMREQTNNLHLTLALKEAAAKKILADEVAEMKGEERSRADFMFKSPLHTLNMGNGVKIR